MTGWTTRSHTDSRITLECNTHASGNAELFIWCPKGLRKFPCNKQSVWIQSVSYLSNVRSQGINDYRNTICMFFTVSVKMSICRFPRTCVKEFFLLLLVWFLFRHNSANQNTSRGYQKMTTYYFYEFRVRVRIRVEISKFEINKDKQISKLYITH